MSSEMNHSSRRATAGYPAYIPAHVVSGNPSDTGSALHGHQFAHGNMAGNDSTLGGVVNQFSALALPNNTVPHAGNTVPAALHHGYDGHLSFLGYAPAPLSLAVGQPVDSSYHMPSAFGSNFNTGFMPYGVMPFTPGRSASTFGERADRGHGEVPGLENRRGSYSTTESAPATPFFGASSDRSNGGARIAVADRSTYTTPSPQQLAVSGMISHVGATKPAPAMDAEIEQLLGQNPPIPRAVPAVFTPVAHIKSLKQCLDNRISGNRNVYIRGLHPTTDDELLLKYAERFGEVETSKAIIDTSTGACKGFGFAKFKDVRNSEKCIRGFYHLGYEVGFARESFNARLKAEGDEDSTNLYLSNLPKRLNEDELNTIFLGYHVVSSKILRDSMGNSRGVGFARFETRKECEEVIKHYHGASIGEEAMLMQVRYADTPAQKELKRVTAERRQFRTNEYNIGAYGTADVGIHPTIYNHGNPSRRGGTGMHSAPGARSAIHNAHDGRHGGGSATRVVDQQQSATVSIKAASDDGSADEGVTVVDSPTQVAKGSTQSSPVIKTERP